jgi:DNA-binding CsgD family transcriptional regulator
MSHANKAPEATSSTQSVEAYQARDTRFISLLTSVGFGCFWSGVVTIVASDVFVSIDLPQPDSLLLRFLFLSGFAAIQFLSYSKVLNETSEGKLQKAIYALMAVMTPVFLATALASSLGAAGLMAFVASAMVWLLFGASCGLLLVAWGISWTQLDAERPDSHASALGVAASVIAAAVLSLFMVFAPQLISIATAGLLFFASLALNAYLMRQYPVFGNIDIKASRQRLDLFSRNLLPPLFVGASFGAILVFGFLTESAVPLFGTVLMGIALGSIAACVTLALLGRVPRYSTFERFVFPILGGGLLLLPFTGGTASSVVIVILIADVACFHIMHWTALVMLSYRHHVRASYHYEQGLISPLCGIALGCGTAGSLVFVLLVPLATATLVMCLVLAFLLILVLSIVPYASNKAVEVMIDAVEEEIGDATGSWRGRSESICKAYLLTPREEEVFLLLAKGRNAEVIAKRLFVSPSTAKTHTARIYRKLSINSQQELIDMVENGTEGSR